jgi:hypothetical protein
MKTLYFTCLIVTHCMLSACGGDIANSNPAEKTAQQQATGDTQHLPPGFLDEPPPPPSSNTQVLSGGTLVLNQIIPDSVLVVQDGILLAWGARGEVAMPNDSIGLDMRGKWIVPGPFANLTEGTLPEVDSWQPQAPANLLIFDKDPRLGKVSEEEIYGRLLDGMLDLPADTEN